jgi:protocatechuate 3,4-dioxygenase beta subunit
MTRKERLLVVATSLGITALVLLGIWSLLPPEVESPEVVIPPGPVIDPPANAGAPEEQPPDGFGPAPPREGPVIVNVEPERETGGSIEGRVVDGLGKPLMNVTLTALQKQSPVRYAFTAENGTYTIASLPAGFYDVRADKEGYAVAGRRGIQVNRLDVTAGVDFELVVGSGFTGSVTDTSGEPVQGANVTLFASGATDDSKGLVRSFRAKTDRDGRFNIENVPPGDYLAMAQEESYLPSERIALNVEKDMPAVYDFMLELGGSVSGRVTDSNGEAIVGAQIYLSVTDGTLSFARGAQTDEDGRYVLKGLESGAVNIRALAPDFISAMKEGISVTEGTATEGVDFTLERGNLISGIVVNNLNEPVRGAVVSGNDGSNYKTVRTDENGNFVLSGFTGDAMSLTVRAEGYILLVKRDIPANSDNLRLELSRGGAIEGQALSDEALDSFVVVVYSIPQGAEQRRLVRQQIVNNPEGHFKVGDIPPGVYTVEVHARKHIQVRPETVEIMENSTVSGLRIMMRLRD